MLQEVNVKNRQLEDAVAQLEQLASTDPLTGLANRRHVQQSLERSFAEAARYGSDLACMMIDLDKFKQLNDSLGHQEGDRLLQTCARVLKANCRRSDLAGRYGGDEFVVLLPHTGPELAHQVARRIQQQFIAAVSGISPSHAACSMSAGLACVSISHPANADQLVALADAALYRAKQSGESCVFTHDAAPTLAQPAGAAGRRPHRPSDLHQRHGSRVHPVDVGQSTPRFGAKRLAPELVILNGSLAAV
jgi:diguanylate cyclase (GGDEF)-like protein